MTGEQQERGDLTATRAGDGNVVSLHDAALVARRDGAPSPSSPAADLSNVIPFARARRAGAEPSTPPVTIGPEDRRPPPLAGTSAARRIAIVACSLAVHGLLLFALWEEPKPLPSIGLEAITVEIVAGDDRPAGVAVTPSETGTLVPSEEVKGVDNPGEGEEERTGELRQAAPDEKQTEPPAERQPETRRELSMVETPQAVIPTAPPRETPPDMTAVITPPREQPIETKPVEPPNAKQPPDPKAKQPERKKAERATRASDAASGAGLRIVASNANYNGRVSAHLQRHKQYPAAAVGRIEGAGEVSFTIDGGGRVTSVSVARGTGSAILDQELTAMVRRASPFPAPPDGQARRFNFPYRFTLKDDM